MWRGKRNQYTIQSPFPLQTTSARVKKKEIGSLIATCKKQCILPVSEHLNNGKISFFLC